VCCPAPQRMNRCAIFLDVEAYPTLISAGEVLGESVSPLFAQEFCVHHLCWKTFCDCQMGKLHI
jgi:hypothetical protein